MQVDVLIVGAGASGLTAGQFLHNYGLSVLILEGASRPYGRVRRVEGFTKFPLEAGGEELYNKKGLYYRIC
jgi:thioredoxin reductase